MRFSLLLALRDLYKFCTSDIANIVFPKLKYLESIENETIFSCDAFPYQKRFVNLTYY